MVLQEQIYQVGVEIIAGPAQGENFISVGPDLTGKTYEINHRLLDKLKNITFRGDGTESPYVHVQEF